MFIAHIETIGGPMTIGLVDLEHSELQERLEALLNALAQLDGPIVLTSAQAIVCEVPSGTDATLTFKHLGKMSLEFADQREFLASVNKHLAQRVFQCVEDLHVDSSGRINGEFLHFELLGEEDPPSAVLTEH